jgi:hypothetical protein
MPGTTFGMNQHGGTKMNLLSPELKAELEKHQGKNVRELMQDGGIFKTLI